MNEINSLIDANKEKLINIFKEERSEEKAITYNFFYAIQGTLFKPNIQNWNEAESKNVITNIDEKIEKAILWFNDGKKIAKRKIKLIDFDKNSKSIIVLISCVEKQENAKITNKFGAFAKYLYNEMKFSELVRKSEAKQNRLFTTNIKEVDEELNIIDNKL